MFKMNVMNMYNISDIVGLVLVENIGLGLGS